MNAQIELIQAIETPIKLARKDIRTAGANLTTDEARFLIDYFYMRQEDRIRSNNQVRTLGKEEQPVFLLNFFADRASELEEISKKALHDYVAAQPVGRWLLSIYGIGPITSAAMLATIDITQAPTAGHIQAFAGMDPTSKWEKGQKRPWCALLKKTMWHVGQSFMKFSGKEDCFYGKLYLERKQYEINRNVSGGNKEAAERELKSKNYSKGTVTYERLVAGMLSDAHIDARARRWTVKIFLSHLHMVWYKHHYGVDAPKPYAIDILKHAHMINPVLNEVL